MKAAIYARVSTANQDTENQIAQLREVAAAKGWEIVRVYTDHGVSGSKGRAGRPQFDAMTVDATKARPAFGVVMAWSVDRLGRSLKDLTSFLSDMHGNKVNLYLHQQNVDTTTPAGKAMFQMMGVFAEFERAMIVDRVNAGLDMARERGVKLGRKPVSRAVVEGVRRDLTGNIKMSYRELSRKHGVSIGKISEIAKQ